jgi:TonB-linked SusC/RagA family outer membrane protein
VLYAQNKVITGKVSDEAGLPLANASVMLKGSASGVATKEDGSFTISLPGTITTLIVSSVGYETKEVKVGNNSYIKINLSSTSSSLENVVVVGYANASKGNVIGSVAKISGEQVANKPVTSFDQALTGKAAGLMIGTASGLIGDNVIMRLRGAASISSGSQPLIIMDGVPLLQGDQGQIYNPANALADINMNDIENIEILKDAAATSLYGSRASGGVILITTKKGKAGKVSLSLDSYAGQTSPQRLIKVLDAGQYVSVINQMRTNAGLANIAALGDYNGDGVQDNTNWQDAVFRKGFTHNHQLSVSGGSEKTTFYGALNYNDFESYLMVNRQSRSSARLNMNSKVNSWLELGFNTQYSQTKSYGLGSGAGAALSGVPYGPLTAYPNVPIYDVNGRYYTAAGGNSPLNNTPNPVAVQTLNFDNRDTRRYIASVFGELSLLKNLKLKTQYNVDYQTAYSDQWWDPSVGDGLGLAGLAQTVYSDNKIWSWFNTLSYNKKIGDHSFSALLGSEYTKRYTIASYVGGNGLNDPLLRIITAANYATVTATNSVDFNNGLASYFGGLNYSYKGKYTASFNIRRDAYSGFGRDNRWGSFPSGSLSWKISQEDFWKSRFVSDLKLRASYGVTGNSNIGNFPSLATFAPSQYADLPTLNLNNPGNTSLRWEQANQMDIGVEATLGKGIGVVLDYYQKKTSDLILNNPVLATIGFPNNTIPQNIGSIESKGLELTINIPVISKRDFSWDMSFNGSYGRTKVLSTNANGDDITGGQSVVRPGYNMSVFNLIRWGGVNPANGLPIFLDINGVEKQYNHATTSWTRVDNGAATTPITATDRVIDNKKTPYPLLFGGMSHNVRYRNFDFSVDLQYSIGAYMYNSTKSSLMVYTSNRNKSTDILRAWSKAGDNTDVPKLIWGDNQSAQASTRWLEKADFIRIRNLQIGYSFDKKLLDKIGFSKFRVYAQAQNPFLFTSYSGIDPESNANGNTNIGLGVDSFRPYLARTITFGINVGF